MPALDEMVRFANESLRLAEIEDYPNALNGLQIENAGEVTKIGAAVRARYDGSAATRNRIVAASGASRDDDAAPR
jgi:hypothetical protein